MYSMGNCPVSGIHFLVEAYPAHVHVCAQLVHWYKMNRTGVFQVKGQQAVEIFR